MLGVVACSGQGVCSLVWFIFKGRSKVDATVAGNNRALCQVQLQHKPFSVLRREDLCERICLCCWS